MTLPRSSDRFYLDAAVGWLLLGNLVEAKINLDRITPLGRLQPEAMLTRWQVFIQLKEWEQAHHLARAFTRLCPLLPAGWVCLSYTLYRMDRHEEARKVLLAQVDRFPQFSVIPYLLASYAWKAGRRQEARQWLTQSAALGGLGVLSRKHLEDCSRLLVGHSAQPKKRSRHSVNVKVRSRRSFRSGFQAEPGS
jgi:predicted Zn-dependent protease